MASGEEILRQGADENASANASAPEGDPDATDPRQSARFQRGLFWLQVAALMGLIGLLAGQPTVYARRLIFLVGLRKQWDPGYLQSDWLFSLPNHSHLVFNTVFGPLALLMSLSAINWVGSIACWLLSLVALFRLGRLFRIPDWSITVALALWMNYRQSIVSYEFIFGSFEAKSVAYPFLLFALEGFLKGKSALPAVLLGLCFSFHPAVGMWGVLAIAGTLCVLRWPWRRLLQVGALFTLFALPGLIPLVTGIFSAAPADPREWRFLARVLFPMHMDPLSWPKRDILLLYAMLLFNWLDVRAQAQPLAPLRFLLVFQQMLALFFTAGIVCRVLDLYGFLRYMPFRLFPMFVMLFFFFHVAHAFYHQKVYHQKIFHRKADRTHAALGLVGLLTLMSFGDPVGRLIDQGKISISYWTRPEEDVQVAFRWVAAHTPLDALVIVPPWRKDSHYLTERGQMATWEIYAHDRPIEWRVRLEALVGHPWDEVAAASWTGRFDALQQGYERLTEADIRGVVARYGGDYLVSQIAYPFPVLFDTGTYKVYQTGRLEVIRGVVSVTRFAPERRRIDPSRTGSSRCFLPCACFLLSPYTSEFTPAPIHVISGPPAPVIARGLSFRPLFPRASWILHPHRRRHPAP